MEGLCKINDDLYWTDQETIRVWARYCAENKRWLETIGGVLMFERHGGQHRVPGVESIDSYRLRGMGPGMMRLLNDQIAARNIRVVHNTAATEILVNYSGEVIGVRARQRIGEEEEREINIQARRAVILATGGFEFDEAMKLQYLKVYPTYFTASPANTGDGIRMALGVGAQLWHMNCVAGGFVMKFPDIPTGPTPTFGGKTWDSQGGSALSDSGEMGGRAQHAERLAASAGYIVVDRYGRRYTNEDFRPHALYYELACFDSQKLSYPRVPSYWIFDQRRINGGPLVRKRSGPAGPARLYAWSADNGKELAHRWIKQGETVKDLALKMGIEPETLIETVKHYNACCKQGGDEEFNRPSSTLIALDSPSYYAVELWSGGPNTLGGPRRNGKAQVMRSDGSPIPRLYSTGELGSIYGMFYPGSGGNLAECIAFGRIAGENASEHIPL